MVIYISGKIGTDIWYFNILKLCPVIDGHVLSSLGIQKRLAGHSAERRFVAALFNLFQRELRHH